MAERPTYREMWPLYKRYWDRMDVKDDREAEALAACEKLLKNKHRYMTVESLTKVPWDMVAVLHMRESGARFDRQLGQGDPLDKVSVHIPKQMGPYLTFEESAYDIMIVKGYNTIVDWRLEKKLYYSENWNGWGYWQYRGQMPSPFLWGATNIQKIGKYIADGAWDPNTWDIQLGCAALLKGLMSLNKPIEGSIYMKREE